jgi:hypothetical protein
MDTTTLLVIVLLFLLLGSGWYGRGRWYCNRADKFGIALWENALTVPE